MMEQKIERIPMGTTRDGKEIHLFRIPNNTNDYIELSTRGCLLKGIYLHASDRSMENVLMEHPAVRGAETLLYVEEAGCPAVMPDTVWDAAEIGENHVFLTCRVDGRSGGIALGARIMWVNLNRLVADLFVTPERTAALSIRSSLMFRRIGEGSCALRTFCPRYRAGDGWRPVVGSPYEELRFQPLTGAVDFSVPEGSEVRPMAELIGTSERLAVSIYGNLPVARVMPLEDGVRVAQTLAEPIALQGGQTCASRVIFGFDRLFPEREREEPDVNPSGVFF